MGLTGDCAATVDHGDELGEAMSELQHERFMRRAIELAANVPELPFGAVIVERESGEIIAWGQIITASRPKLWPLDHGSRATGNRATK